MTTYPVQHVHALCERIIQCFNRK